MWKLRPGAMRPGKLHREAENRKKSTDKSVLPTDLPPLGPIPDRIWCLGVRCGCGAILLRVQELGEVCPCGGGPGERK
jgi:hypothetical protein